MVKLNSPLTLKKFIIFKKFFNQTELETLKRYSFCLLRKGGFFEASEDSLGETVIEGDAYFDSLMETNRKKIEQLTELKLLPVISNLKIFINESQDKPHREVNHRQACVTINIASDKIWKSTIDGEEFFLDPGDAVFYTSNLFDFGKINKYEGDHYLELSFFYCQNNPEMQNFKFDGRSFLGCGHTKVI